MTMITNPDAYLLTPVDEAGYKKQNTLVTYLTMLPPGGVMPATIEVEIVNSVGDVVAEALISGTIVTIVKTRSGHSYAVFSSGERIALYNHKE